MIIYPAFLMFYMTFMLLTGKMKKKRKMRSPTSRCLSSLGSPSRRYRWIPSQVKVSQPQFLNFVRERNLRYNKFNIMKGCRWIVGGSRRCGDDIGPRRSFRSGGMRWSDLFDRWHQITQLIEYLTRDSGSLGSNQCLVHRYFYWTVTSGMTFTW